MGILSKNNIKAAIDKIQIAESCKNSRKINYAGEEIHYVAH